MFGMVKKFNITLFLILFIPLNILAEQNPPEPKTNYLKDFSLLTAGVLTQYSVHEFGHYIGFLAAGKGSEIIYSHNGNFRLEGDLSNRSKNTIAASGFVLPLVVSETMLDSKISKGNPYVMGLILGPLMHNTFYITRDLSENRRNKHNDIHQMNQNGINREITYPLMIILPAIQVYRLSRDEEAKEKWNIWMRIQGNQNKTLLTVGYNF
jgi:hypothetical protein